MISTFWLSPSKGEQGSNDPGGCPSGAFHSYFLERGGPCGTTLPVWWNSEFIWKEEQLSSKETTGLLPHLTVIHQSSDSLLSKPIPAKSFFNPRAQLKGKNCQQEKTISMPSAGGILLAYIFFPKVATVRLQPASYSDGGSLRTKLKKVMWGPPTPVPPVSPPHSPPLTWVILSTETGIPSIVRGGSSELTSCGAGACSARADSRSSRIMLLYLRTCRELRAEVNKMPNNQGGLVPSNHRVGRAGLPQPLQSPKNKHVYN